jgi:hypothetical protein
MWYRRFIHRDRLPKNDDFKYFKAWVDLINVNKDRGKLTVWLWVYTLIKAIASVVLKYIKTTVDVINV